MNLKQAQEREKAIAAWNEIRLERYSEVFEEWKRLYDEDPDAFVDCLGFQDTPPKTYGEEAARYFIMVLDKVKAREQD